MLTQAVGPAHPQTTCWSRRLRYPLELFSVSSPQFVSSTPLGQEFDACLRLSDAKVITKSLESASSKLTPTKARSAGGQIGFFEQAIFTGLGMIGTASLVSLGTFGYFGVRLFRSMSG